MEVEESLSFSFFGGGPGMIALFFLFGGSRNFRSVGFLGNIKKLNSFSSSSLASSFSRFVSHVQVVSIVIFFVFFVVDHLCWAEPIVMFVALEGGRSP